MLAGILRNIHAALKPGARFVLTALNGLRKIREFNQKDVESGKFDPVAIIEVCTMEWDTPQDKKSATVKERGHMPGELARLFRDIGFHVDHVWGGTAGNWGRRAIDLDEMEIMIVAQKPGRGRGTT